MITTANYVVDSANHMVQMAARDTIDSNDGDQESGGYSLRLRGGA